MSFSPQHPTGMSSLCLKITGEEEGGDCGGHAHCMVRSQAAPAQHRVIEVLVFFIFLDFIFPPVGTGLLSGGVPAQFCKSDFVLLQEEEAGRGFLRAELKGPVDRLGWR